MKKLFKIETIETVNNILTRTYLVEAETQEQAEAEILKRLNDNKQHLNLKSFDNYINNDSYNLADDEELFETDEVEKEDYKKDLKNIIKQLMETINLQLLKSKMQNRFAKIKGFKNWQDWLSEANFYSMAEFREYEDEFLSFLKTEGRLTIEEYKQYFDL
jgi:hypothetical protein